MQREQRDSEQRQGMDQLVLHAGLEYREMGGAQLAAQAVGGEGAEGDAGQTEQGGKHEIATNHCFSGRWPERPL